MSTEIDQIRLTTPDHRLVAENLDVNVTMGKASNQEGKFGACKA
jgi:hypothetical protein